MLTKIIIIVWLILCLTPKETMAENYLIRVSFSEFQLSVIKNGTKIKNFLVALPKITPKLPIRGYLIKIEKNPYWYPTTETRKCYLTANKVELPVIVKPGDPRNAMGAVKIIIFLKTAGVDQNVRIHGTNDRESIGKRASRGCIRMLNEDILIMVKIIEKEILNNGLSENQVEILFE